MIKCTRCNQEKGEEEFISKNRLLKQCLSCREKSKLWKENNKDAISLYNKTYRNNNFNIKEKTYVYAKLFDSNNEWIKFNSQLEAARQLNLYPENVNKVINGHLNKTGGYIFKIESKTVVNEHIDWENVKNENNIVNKCIGKPSKHRISHEIFDNVVGKKCCKCKEWNPLSNYNLCNSHWDKLRVECKNCISEWRRNNREKINEKFKIYEKKRKLIDPEFKLLKTLRSRLVSALKRQSSSKTNKTVELLGCSVSFLRQYLQDKFKEGMTWENHGSWHIDHIIPCASFNLLDTDEQKKCFHYTNLQPLWGYDNLSKGCKI